MRFLLTSAGLRLRSLLSGVRTITTTNYLTDRQFRRPWFLFHLQKYTKQSLSPDFSISQKSSSSTSLLLSRTDLLALAATDSVLFALLGNLRFQRTEVANGHGFVLKKYTPYHTQRERLREPANLHRCGNARGNLRHHRHPNFHSPVSHTRPNLPRSRRLNRSAKSTGPV